MDESTLKQERVEYLSCAELNVHPRNMRRVYPAADVEQMANSIRERGIIQPLICMRLDDGRVYVVAGNLRLSAARSLNDEKLLVPVIVRERSDAEQLLDMAAENAIRFDPDVVSEGLHYRAILEQDGMTQTRLARLTGVSAPRIVNRLRWAEVEPEIQGMAMRGELPKLAIDDLLRLPAGEVRMEAARRFVRIKPSLRTVRSSCTHILNEMARKDKPGRAVYDPNGPALALAIPSADYNPADYNPVDYNPAGNGGAPVVSSGRGETPPAATPLPPGVVRSAAARACELCPNRDTLGVPEPAWSILAHGARETCGGCWLRRTREFCNECPLVVALRHTYRQVVREEGGVPHEHF